MIECDMREFLIREEDNILKVQHPLYEDEDESSEDVLDRLDFEQDMEVAEWKERGYEQN